MNFRMDAALTQAGDIGSISLQIALQLVYLFQILLCSGAAPGSVHPYGNLFHNIVGLVKLSDNVVYQFLVAEAEPGPDLFMHMIAVAEVLVIQAAFYHSLKVLKLVSGPSIPIRQHRGLRQVIVPMQIAFYHCKKFFSAGRCKAAKSYQFCPVAIFPDSLIYLDAVHFRNAAFLLVLEYNSISFNRYNFRLCRLFNLFLFCQCFFISLRLLAGIVLE